MFDNTADDKPYGRLHVALQTFAVPLTTYIFELQVLTQVVFPTVEINGLLAGQHK